MTSLFQSVHICYKGSLMNTLVSKSRRRLDVAGRLAGDSLLRTSAPFPFEKVILHRFFKLPCLLITSAFLRDRLLQGLGVSPRLKNEQNVEIDSRLTRGSGAHSFQNSKLRSSINNAATVGNQTMSIRIKSCQGNVAPAAFPSLDLCPEVECPSPILLHFFPFSLTFL